MSIRARRAAASRVFCGLIVVALACTGKPTPAATSAPTGPTPDSFLVKFTTTRGDFVVEAHRAWAPNGVDRLYALVTSGALDDAGFFRVVPKFIVQFGATGVPAINARWDSVRIADDARATKNLRGTMAFAQDGPGTRTHQLFVNLSDNAHLDQLSFAPIGVVVEGMNVVDSINATYGEKPDYHLIATIGNDYLHRMFPKLDYVKTARVVR